jgi:hypothetical protein
MNNKIFRKQFKIINAKLTLLIPGETTDMQIVKPSTTDNSRIGKNKYK